MMYFIDIELLMGKCMSERMKYNETGLRRG